MNFTFEKHKQQQEEKETFIREIDIPRIVYNAIQTPDGTVLESLTMSDYRQHLDEVTNELYFCHGGNRYLARNLNIFPYIELSLHADGDFELIRQRMAIFSNLALGIRTRKPVKLCNLSDKILEKKIKANQDKTDPYNQMFQKEWDYRVENRIVVPNDIYYEYEF